VQRRQDRGPLGRDQRPRLDPLLVRTGTAFAAAGLAWCRCRSERRWLPSSGPPVAAAELDQIRPEDHCLAQSIALVLRGCNVACARCCPPCLPRQSDNLKRVSHDTLSRNPPDEVEA
jgi:hypothetical protein